MNTRSLELSFCSDVSEVKINAASQTERRRKRSVFVTGQGSIGPRCRARTRMSRNDMRRLSRIQAKCVSPSSSAVTWLGWAGLSVDAKIAVLVTAY